MGRHFKRTDPTSWLVELKKRHETYRKEEFASYDAALLRARKLVSLHSLDFQTHVLLDWHLRVIRVDASSYYAPGKTITDGPFQGGIKVNGTRRGKTC
jgi:hypothetical protein